MSPMITKEDIQHLAKLSRIGISEAEAEELTKEVDSILGYIGQINEVTGDVKAIVPPLRNVMRDDVVTHESGEYTDAIFANVPKKEGGYLKVKKILG
jgi:aspartyl-tRNA(Asn)/glutamyl-tRNA(Gln) amidotransferase subunit C